MWGNRAPWWLKLIINNVIQRLTAVTLQTVQWNEFYNVFEMGKYFMY